MYLSTSYPRERYAQVLREAETERLGRVVRVRRRSRWSRLIRRPDRRRGSFTRAA